jgi:hypothetical protein
MGAENVKRIRVVGLNDLIDFALEVLGSHQNDYSYQTLPYYQVERRRNDGGREHDNGREAFKGVIETCLGRPNGQRRLNPEGRSFSNLLGAWFFSKTEDEDETLPRSSPATGWAALACSGLAVVSLSRPLA